MFHGEEEDKQITNDGRNEVCSSGNDRPHAPTSKEHEEGHSTEEGEGQPWTRGEMNVSQG